MVPADVRAGIESAVGAAIVEESRLSGGCISPAARVQSADGRVYFTKWATGGTPAGLFEAEARGLAALHATGTVRVPHVVGVADGWLLLEWLEPGTATAGTWQRLGRELAGLHSVRSDRYGETFDNFIGSLPQSNRRQPGWAEFWRSERLAPQLLLAAHAFASNDRSRFDRFLAELDDLLDPAGEEGASLLHGDLWSGNVHIIGGGQAALIDPSCYHGHREVDLAMATLFGGFGADFFEAYEETRPLRPGWRERRAAYQLYYLLVHVNLFGRGYVGQTLAALRAAGG